jgi:AGZA family xanthine/uracil permease-like MFS transporter
MLDRFFKISERGSTVGREVRGGFVTFFTMAYIIALNPLILGFTKDADGKFIGGLDHPDLPLIAAATALIAGIMTILMGVVANFPLAIATGLGLNSFVALGVATRMTWADAMGLVVIEGIIISILVLTGFRQAIFKAVPQQLKYAISVGIGLFIALIGLVDSGFVRRTGAGPVPVQLGDNGNLDGWPVIVFIVGLALILILMVRKTKGALLIGILGATVIAVIVEKAFKIGPSVDAAGHVNPKGWGLNVPTIPSKIIATPKFDLLGHFNLLGSFNRVSAVAGILIIFTLVLSDFFDLVGTVTAIGHEAELIQPDGMVPNNNKVLLVDGLAAVAGGLGSVSSNTAYIESASGVGEGARTGLASVVTGICLLLSTFLAPLVAVIPYEAATPALVIVGFLMMTQVKDIDWKDLGIAIPAFLTIILMPFTYSISVGIGAGFITHVLIRWVQGRRKEIHPLLLIVALFFLVFFLTNPINTWVGGK